MCEAKAAYTNKGKSRNEFTASHHQADDQPSPGKQGSITCKSDLEWQMPSLKASSTSLFCALFYILSMMPCDLEYPLVSWDQGSQVSFPNFLSSPSPLILRVVGEMEKALLYVSTAQQ